MSDLPLDDLPRGLGDPDFYGYPGQKPATVHYIGEDKAVVQRHYEPRNRRDSYPWSEDVDYDPKMDEDWDET